MELDITEFFKAGTNHMILDTEKKREVFRSFVRSAGALSDRVAVWSDAELNALCIQWVAGDMLEPFGFDLGPDTTDEEWAEYQRQSEAGQVSGRIFKGIDGRFYFYCGE